MAQQTPAGVLAGPPHGRSRREPEPASDTEGKTAQSQLLDPLWCQMACQLPIHPGITPAVGLAASAAQASPALPLRDDLQNLLTGLARRVAWGGDRRKGSARIELSEGALAGATLIVHTEQRSVSVELELPAGVGAQGWEARLVERLEARGFSARVRVG